MKLVAILFLVGVSGFATSSALSCGKRYADQHLDKLQQWIVGGVPALRGAYPYQVSLEWVSWLYGTQHVCGGTVISPNWVVTAAHCIFDGRDPSHYRVVVGRHNLKKREASVRYHHIKKVIVHPNWRGEDSDDMSNDITLLELKNPIKFTKFVQPACLPKAENYDTIYAPGKEAIISGWGEMDPKAVEQEEPGRSPKVMRAALVPIMDSDVCKKSNEIYEEMVTETMMCAGYRQGLIDGCQGDSGGPLVEIVDGQVTLIGVVSWGVGCAQKDYPGIYTNVAHMLPWIQTHVKL